eukprot:6353496-Prymnesium_polylepis.1
MAMAKMAGDADSERGCDEGARTASSVHLAAEGKGGGRKTSRCESWMKLDRNGRRGAQNVPTRQGEGNETSVKWRNREVWNFQNRQQRL